MRDEMPQPQQLRTRREAVTSTYDLWIIAFEAGWHSCRRFAWPLAVASTTLGTLGGYFCGAVFGPFW